ncbi:uncharacterized protein LOC135498834 [Lineus longissimus]|uniref:uncharacterized protein LOC135498834 n=1 Tax=Lineus longissimus TaxID=88925 RepID=UPI002B4EB7BB
MGLGEGQSMRIDKGFLIPKGILKLLQVICGATCLGLVIVGGGFNKKYHQDFKTDEYRQAHTYALATPIIWFVTSLVLFVLFLLSCGDRCGGKSCWILIDLVCDAVAALMYFAAFLILAIYCGWPKLDHNPNFTQEELAAASAVALAACILYLVELVINIRARK